MAIVCYHKGEQPKNSWVRYFNRRIQLNKNNLVVFTGSTGSGKTWSAASILEIMSKEDGAFFGIDHIVFSLKELMELINSDKLKKGSKILFDEPQVSISNREFQSEANKVFNYLLSTFRHRNWTLFFCTPYEDLLDKSTRKLFHAKFETTSINVNTGTCRIKPKFLEYNSQIGKFYEKFLRVSYRPKGSDKNIVTKLKYWDIPKPSKDLIVAYEQKKENFTTNLNKNIMNRLNKYEEGGKSMTKAFIEQTDRTEQKPLSPRQKWAWELACKGNNQVQIAKIMGISPKNANKHLFIASTKGYLVKNKEIAKENKELPP